MAYLDIYVMPVPADRLEEYRQAAADSAVIWRELGALSVVEAVADDLAPGTRTSFARSVQLQPGETVVVSVIRYRDRAQRDAIAPAAMADPRAAEIMQNIPVDGARMFWCGFDVIVDA